MAKLSKALILTLFSLMAIIGTFCETVSGTRVGGATDVEDVKTNEEVQELGRFSVEEFNRKHGGGNGGGGLLMFSEVIEAKKQVISGIKYYLKIEAMRDGKPRVFQSVVVVKPWIHSKQLVNFAPAM